ncbi:hypothetical protein [Halarcobacter sp.]|uniref:hypothetical protein n=1 Tax=Halarcobacter sp. TaxID=2321133 RepID=UPI002AAB4C25|nr:hypothetical protein [Halarcobacter sp.]
MSQVPELINNPNNPSFYLDELEIYNIKEAKELIDIEKLSFSLFAIWNCVTVNLQRRIEFFGIENFLNLLKNKSLYNKNANTLKQRWLNIDELDLIEYSKELNLINNISYELIKVLFWLKTDVNQDQKTSKEEIYSLIFLLEKNLFCNKFKKDKREFINSNKSDFKRRKEDTKEKIISISTTHQELLLKNSVEHFKNNLETNNKNDKLLTAYI